MADNTVKGFFLYFDQWPAIKALSDQQKALLLEAMFLRFSGQEYEIADPVVNMAFLFIESTFSRDVDKYKKKCEKNAENAKQRKQATASDGKRPLATASDGDNINKKENKKKTNLLNPPLSPQGGKSGAKREPTGNSKPELQAQIAAYTDSQEFRDALEAYREMRERIRKPLTAYALKLALKHLDEMAEHIPTKIAIVNQSVLNSWQDLYPLKGNASTQQQPRAKPGQFDMDRQSQTMREVYQELMEDKQHGNTTGFSGTGNTAQADGTDGTGFELRQGFSEAFGQGVDAIAGAV